MTIQFRRATEEDYDFLYNLSVATMKEYITAIWGWDENWQKSYFRQVFPNKSWQVIVTDSVGVGAFVVEEGPEEIYLANLYISPEYQKKGIGTQVVRRIQKRAYELGVPVALDVLRSNSGARRLYERLGFQTVKETAERFMMRLDPSNPARPVSG